MGILDDSVRLVGGVMNDEMSQAAEANAEVRHRARMAGEQNLGQMRAATEREAFSREHSNAVSEAQRTMHNGAQSMDASEMVVKQQPEWDGVEAVGYDGLQLG